MIGVWFTYRNDALCLEQSVRAFRHVAGGEAIVCVLDDAKARLPVERINTVRPDHYEVTDWPRRRNLVGWDQAVCGLEAYLRMAEKFEGDGVVKIDCDTLLLDGSWVDRSRDLDGWEAPRFPHMAGICYWVGRQGAERVLHGIKDLRWLDHGKSGEDLIYSCWFRQYCDRVQLRPFDLKQFRGVQYTPQGDMQSADYSQTRVLTFGNRTLMKEVPCGPERFERAALFMSRFLQEKWPNQD